MNRRSLITHTVAVVFLQLTLPVAASDKDQIPELDVVATTNVDVSQAFVKACIPNIVAQVRDGLYGLSPVDASDGKAKDGAARYRLLIDHKGSVSVGKTLTVRSTFPIMKEETVKKGNMEITRLVPDKTHYLTTWYLPIKQKATLTFTLQKWDATAYKTLDTWSIPVANGEWVENGLSPVAEVKQDATKPNFKPSPECPKSMEELRDEGYVGCIPGSFETAFAARWLKGKFDKLTPRDGEVDYDISVDNKSPWPLSRIYVESTDKDQSLVGYVEFKPAIAAGKSGKGKGSCFVTEVPKKAPGMRITEASFEPGK